MDFEKETPMTFHLGTICQHGSLKRSCYTCELEAEVKRLRRIEEAAKAFIKSLSQDNQDYRQARYDLLLTAFGEERP